MWKILNPPTSGMQNTQRSSNGTNAGPSTAKPSPQKPSSTPFLRSESEVRFALESGFAFDSDGKKRVPPLPTVTPAVAVHNTFPDSTQPSPTPNQNHRGANAPYRPGPSDDRFASHPNNGQRFAPRQTHPPSTLPAGREDAAFVPLRGQYVTVVDKDPAGEDPDTDPPPGLNDDLSTAVCKFAWAYAKGLGGLVMGVMDGLARGDGGPPGYLTYGACAHGGARKGGEG